MHFGIFTYGSRGDVQPYIALALGLMQRGHQVTLAAPENFKQLVESYQVAYLPLVGNVEDIVHSAEFEKILRSGNDLAFMRYMYAALHNNRYTLFANIMQLVEGCDVIISNNIGAITVSVATDYLNKKLLIIQLNPPVIPTRAFAVPGMDIMNNRVYNRFSYFIFYKILWQLAKKDIADFRKQLNLPPIKTSVFKQLFDSKVPMLHAYSTALINRPHDWESHHLFTGFFNIKGAANSTNVSDTEQLKEWISAGEKPVYIGFGSIPVPHPEKFRNMLQDILDHTAHRIVYCKGWSQIPDLPVHPNLFVISQANHQWLLPQCKAAVIHGGIGTLSAVLHAGIPVLVASIFADQPIWGKIVARKKLGVHMPCRKLNFERFSRAMDVLADRQIVENAAAISKVLMAEDGVANAVQYIENYATSC